MNERDPIGNDARRKRRERELGVDAVCLFCGEDDKTILERHHVVGAANDPKLTVIACRNCHGKQTEAQRVYGIELDRATTRNTLVIVEMVLRGLAILFGYLADSLWELADRLAAELDASLPGWRDRPSFGH
jgi:hypothetical protein